ncbi:MAG: hypothetical protein LBN29_07890 [Mediterranea sp.]|nr:hypothetical protein [Mediterranea sp.]
MMRRDGLVIPGEEIRERRCNQKIPEKKSAGADAIKKNWRRNLRARMQSKISGEEIRGRGCDQKFLEKKSAGANLAF